MTLEESIDKYTEYIHEHQNNVKLAWKNIQPKLKGVYWLEDNIYIQIDSQVKTHDLSKFDDKEFNGYRQWFSPHDNETRDRSMFDYAWLNHIHKNPHHWNYWVLDGKPLDMPFRYIFEMLLDWTAMSYKFNNCPKQYWINNQHTMNLHCGTISCVNNWIDIFKEMVNINDQQNNC